MSAHRLVSAPSESTVVGEGTRALSLASRHLALEVRFRIHVAKTTHIVPSSRSWAIRCVGIHQGGAKFRPVYVLEVHIELRPPIPNQPAVIED